VKECNIGGSTLLFSLYDPALILDHNGAVVSVNPSWLEVNNSIRNLLNNKELIHGAREVLSSRISSFKLETSIYIEARELCYVIRATPITEESEIVGVLIVFYDITDQKKLEREMERSSLQFKLIAEHSNDMIKITDACGNVEYASPSHEKILGYTDQSNIFEYAHPQDADILRDAYIQIVRNKVPQQLQIRKKHKDGTWVWVETVCSPVLANDGSVQNVVLITRDITERKQYQTKLEQMAYHDYLTGLFNRRRIKMEMEKVLDYASGGNKKFAFLIMDIDKFKLINDTYGHDIGDMVLQQFSNRLLECRRDTDIVGRLSGDEFAVVMKQVRGREDVQVFIDRFQFALLQPFLVPDLEIPLHIRSSIGYSIYPDHGCSVKELFKQADISLYQEKKKPYKAIKSGYKRRARRND
jgi:diguanylate cyclase (GGDEF)-like protein/PAS domain S-box-containing protein